MKRTKELEEIINTNFENVKLDSDNIVDLSYDDIKAKKEKSVTILGKKIVLSHNNFNYNYMYTLLSSVKEVYMSKIRSLGIYDATAKYTKYELGELKDKLLEFSKVIMISYVDNVTKIKSDDLQEACGLLVIQVINFLNEYKEFDKTLSNRVNAASSQLTNAINTANAKAYGSEAGVLYGTSSYGGATIGTKLVGMTYEADTDRAFSDYNYSISNIKYTYEQGILSLCNRTLNNLLFTFLDYCFKDKIEDYNYDEIKDNYLCDKTSLDNFIKYPFIVNNYITILSELNDEDLKILNEIVEYYNNKEKFIDNLKIKIYFDYNSNKSNIVTDEDVYNPYYNMYSVMINEDKEKYISTFIKEYFIDKIKHTYSDLEDRNNDFEFICEKIETFSKYLTDSDIKEIKKELNIKYKETKTSNFKTHYKEIFLKNMLLIILLFTTTLILMLINTDLITFGKVLTSIFYSALISLGTTLVYSYLILTIPSSKIVDWEKERFDLTKQKLSKIDKICKLSLILIFIIIGLIIKSSNNKDKEYALNIYDKYYVVDSSIGSKDYIMLESDGTMHYAWQNGATYKYTLYEYKCSVNEGDTNKLEGYASFYKHYNLSCKYDNYNFDIEISARYEKGDSNNITVYKSEYEKYIPGYKTGEDYRETVKPSDFSFK